MDVLFPLNNPIKPCSVLDKICWYTATTNIKITEIIPFTEKTNVKNRTFLASMDVMSLYTNIQQNKGILKLSVTKHMKDNPFLHCWKCLEESLRKISSTSMESTTYKTMELQGTRQQFWFLWRYFHDIYETTTLGKPVFRTTVWKCYIHDIFSLCDMSKPDIEAFIEKANLHHPTIVYSRPKHLMLRLRF